MKNKLSIKKLKYAEFAHFIDSELSKNKKTGVTQDEDDLLYIEPGCESWITTWGGYCNGELCAYLAININHPNYCDKLYVSPRIRRLGIAKFMLDELDITSVSVMRSNVLAMHFYTACGFKEQSAEHNLCFLVRESIKRSVGKTATEPSWNKW